MNKFVSGVIAGAVVSTAASVALTNKKPQKSHSKKTIGKALHNLGDMADNMAK